MALRRLLRGPWLHFTGDSTQQLASALGTTLESQLPANNMSLQQLRGMARQRKKVTVDMVLIKDHPHLGKAGDVVQVRPGHARLDLYPKQLAVYATEENLKRYAKTRQQTGATEAGRKRELTLTDILNKLNTNQLVASRRAAPRGAAPEEQHMVGLVSRDHIAGLVLSQLHIELPPSQILMDSHIDQFGFYKVPLNLRTNRGKQVELKLEVKRVRKIRR